MDIIRLENIFNLQHTHIKEKNNPSWKYEEVKKDTKSLQQRSQKLIVKMKLNKLLVARIIISVHAWKGRDVKMKFDWCQFTHDILLLRSYDNHLLRCQSYRINMGTEKKHVLPLQIATIEHPLIQGKLTIFGKIVPNLLKCINIFLPMLLTW